jgi:hypothetical protein
MTRTLPEDILLPSGPSEHRPQGNRLAAFIPISVAVAGVAAILFGGVAAQTPVLVGDAGVDQMVTGSIQKPSPIPAPEAGHAE